MRDISARELKGHNILAVERFQDSTRWMIEFSVQRPCSYGCPGDDMRLFLTEDGYQAALVSQKRREIKIKRYARPFLSDKYDITKHPNYPYTADADPKNAFDIEAFLSTRLKLKPNEVYDVYEVDAEGA